MLFKLHLLKTSLDVLCIQSWLFIPRHVELISILQIYMQGLTCSSVLGILQDLPDKIKAKMLILSPPPTTTKICQ